MNRQERQVAIVVLAIVVLGAAAIHWGKPHHGKPGLVLEKAQLTNEFGKVVREERVRFPESIPGLASTDAPITSFEDVSLPKDTTFGRKLYRDEEGFRMQLSAVMMKTDRTSIHRPQLCLFGQGWTVQKTEVIEIPVPLPSPYQLKATCVTCSKKVRDPKTEKEFPVACLYIYWYVSEHRLAAEHGEAIWDITKGLITSGTLEPWAYISCFGSFLPGQEGAALVRMKRLISEAVPQFQLYPRPNPKQTASLQKVVPLN
jgi:hypothetical protein